MYLQAVASQPVVPPAVTSLQAHSRIGTVMVWRCGLHLLPYVRRGSVVPSAESACRGWLEQLGCGPQYAVS